MGALTRLCELCSAHGLARKVLQDTLLFSCPQGPLPLLCVPTSQAKAPSPGHLAQLWSRYVHWAP